MTKLPEKELLSGSKMPRTTTGEMKNALGRLRDYLAELFGDDSSDKEAARKTLGIDLPSLAVKPEVDSALLLKADKTDMQEALSQKAGKDELDALEEAISRRGTPVGSIEYFAMATPPAGYLKADGAEVGRETYPDLFAAIGTTFGEGDGETTFNLPDLIDRFAQGSATPGRKVEAGLPNITGDAGGFTIGRSGTQTASGALSLKPLSGAYQGGTGGVSPQVSQLYLNGSDSSSFYGASDTVQPPALTLLPCIKTFDAATNPGLVDLTELAQEMANKTDAAGAAHAAMPSDRHIELTLPESGGKITVPTDGYLMAKLTGSNAGYFSADTYRGETYIASHISTYAFGAFFLFCPVSAGNTLIIYNTTSATPEIFSFIYANGSVPQ